VEQARDALPATKIRAKPAVPGRQIPSDRYSDQQLHQFWCQQDLVLTQFKQRLPQAGHLTQNLQPLGRFGQGFVEVLAAQQRPIAPSWFEGTADEGA